MLNPSPEQKQQAVVGYVIQFLAPPLAGGASYRNIKAAVLKEPDWMGRTRSLNTALLGAFAGLKIRPIDADEETMWRIKEIQAQIQAVKDNFYKTAVSPAVDEQSKQEAADRMLDTIDELVAEMNAIGEARSPAQP